MPRYALDHPRWSPAAILESMARDVRKLVRMFKNHWYSVGEVGGEVRRNCLVYAIHCMTPNCFTTRDIVVGAALASRSDQLGWRRGRLRGIATSAWQGKGCGTAIAWPQR